MTLEIKLIFLTMPTKASLCSPELEASGFSGNLFYFIAGKYNWAYFKFSPQMIHYLAALPNLISGITSGISHQREFTQKLRLHSETQAGSRLRGTRSQYRAGRQRGRADPEGPILETEPCNQLIRPSVDLKYQVDRSPEK